MDNKNKARAIYLHTVLGWEVEGAKSTNIANNLKYTTDRISEIYNYLKSVGLNPYLKHSLAKSDSSGVFRSYGFDEDFFIDFVESKYRNIYTYIKKTQQKGR